ncbi:hypothetical protein PSE10A_54020 [Pseudomonas amygdali pv. eriobotryae]|uniref:Uncharacterized protein n=1 Tax=Pseudomonas amygdali pv. eriobotryae TaxID=129137 RepID=A0A9P3AJJ2_PSEA0|nr:hypothetical protein PSE10A_54020 [Pseudomonas amygdali pv. eriobotryae]
MGLDDAGDVPSPDELFPSDILLRLSAEVEAPGAEWRGDVCHVQEPDRRFLRVLADRHPVEAVHSGSGMDFDTRARNNEFPSC